MQTDLGAVVEETHSNPAGCRPQSLIPGRRLRDTWLAFCLGLLFLGVAPITWPGVLPGDIFPNSSLETDSNSNGTPDFWNKGGSASIDFWMLDPISSTHALQLIDTNTATFGEWYSDRLGIDGGAAYLLRYSLRYADAGNMRVSVNFYDSGGNLLNILSFGFAGTQPNWTELTQRFTSPGNATQLHLTFTSGGAADVTGTAWLDNISLAPAHVPYLENFPRHPNPYVLRDWKKTARDYHMLAFNPNASGQYLPLLYEYSTTTIGYSGEVFGLPSYVGWGRDSGEALSVLGAVLGGSMAGLDMSNWNGKDRVRMTEVFYTLINGHGLVFNNLNSGGAGSAWYDIFPSALFYQIGSRYPGRLSYQSKMRAIANSWLEALSVLSGNWEHTGFSFSGMNTVDQAWHEPDMAIGIAWLEYMAYLQFGDPKYLQAADTCLSQFNNRGDNPFYEVLGYFGPPLTARMNAEWGRTYDTRKHLTWIFSSTSNVRPGWGCVSARWGDYDAFGLMGSTTDSSGYTFSMNTFTAAGIITPTIRYESQYARQLGRWLHHVAVNANLYYPDTLPANMQSGAAWSQQTGVRCISYEGVRNQGATTPYATGDVGEPAQDFNPYGAWGSGYLAALFQTSNVPDILQVDCLATESFPPPAYPTFLYYNPHTTFRRVLLDVGPQPKDLYDAVSQQLLVSQVTGMAGFNVPADDARVVVVAPADGKIVTLGNKTLVNGVVVDWQSRPTSKWNFLPAGSIWKYHDNGADLGTAWREPGYNDTAWRSGPAQLGFGDGDESTLVVSNRLRVTTYFRHTFLKSAANRFSNLEVRLLRDDGAVVYLNGTEVFRQNLPATQPITCQTLALTNVGGSDETSRFYSTSLDPSLLRDGANLLAVEVHQSGTNSSDLSFDLELSGTPSAPLTLIPPGAVWRYWDANSDPGLNWQNPSFNDADWPNGTATLGFGNGDETTVISNRFQITTFFRGSLFVPAPAAVHSLTARVLRDDGAIIYLNGVEVWRDNLPEGSVLRTTLARSTINGHLEQDWLTASLPPALLVPGTNLLAVEIHQAATNSTDLAFNLELIAAVLPAASPPRLEALLSPEYLQLHWSATNGFFKLYSSDDFSSLMHWSPVTAPLEFSNGFCSATVPFKINRTRFFRLLEE